MPQQDKCATQLKKAEEVVGMVLIPSDKTAEVMDPCK